MNRSMDQSRRYGNPDYDCSSLVFYALKEAGLITGSSAFGTADMENVLTAAGFTEIDYDPNALQEEETEKTLF